MKENYFDRNARGEYSIDPRDLLPIDKPRYLSVVIYDENGFRELMREGAEEIIKVSRLHSREAVSLAAQGGKLWID